MIYIELTCENGHSERLGVDPRLGLGFAYQQAGLMDGTSPHYVVSPVGTPSPIGKCGRCKAQLTAIVSEMEIIPDESPVVSQLSVPKVALPAPATDKIFVRVFLVCLVAAVFWFVGREIWKLFAGESI